MAWNTFSPGDTISSTKIKENVEAGITGTNVGTTGVAPHSGGVAAPYGFDLGSSLYPWDNVFVNDRVQLKKASGPPEGNYQGLGGGDVLSTFETTHPTSVTSDRCYTSKAFGDYAAERIFPVYNVFVWRSVLGPPHTFSFTESALTTGLHVPMDYLMGDLNFTTAGNTPGMPSTSTTGYVKGYVFKVPSNGVYSVSLMVSPSFPDDLFNTVTGQPFPYRYSVVNTPIRTAFITRPSFAKANVYLSAGSLLYVHKEVASEVTNQPLFYPGYSASTYLDGILFGPSRGKSMTTYLTIEQVWTFKYGLS